MGFKNHLAVLGQSDPPLSPEGREQARLLAAALAGEVVARVLSSSLRRAQQTADILLKRADKQLRVATRPALKGPAQGHQAT